MVSKGKRELIFPKHMNTKHETKGMGQELTILTYGKSLSMPTVAANEVLPLSKMARLEWN